MGKIIIIPDIDYSESSIPIAQVSESGESVTFYVNGTEWDYTQNPAVRANCVEIEVPLYDGKNIVNIDFGDTTITNLTAFTNKYKAGEPEFYLVGEVDFSSVAVAATNYTSAFNGQANITELDLTGWFLPSSQYNIEFMFYGCSALKEIKGISSGFICKTSIDYAFYNCSSLESIDFSVITSASITLCRGVFYGCSKLQYLDLSGIDVSSCVNFENMFYDCSNLTTIDLSGWEVSSTASKGNMFTGCGVEKIYVDGCSADSKSVILSRLSGSWSESTEGGRAVLIKS